MIKNPFAVVSPEELSAEQANQLFVETYSDYPEINRPGNTLVTGARGCGKTMLIRCSQPDFLMVRKNLSFSQLPYFSVNVSIKKTSLNLEELRILDNKHLPFSINEHFISLNVMMFTFLSLSQITFEQDSYSVESYQTFFDAYKMYLRASGCNNTPKANYDSPNSFFKSLYDHLFLMSCDFIPYFEGLYRKDNPNFEYMLPLLSYKRFIVPVFKELISVKGFPNGKPILIFIDDADNLSKTQTQIINSWLATRTQPTISLKVFSQIGLYKSFLTPTGELVESPHDYQEVNISSIYTNALSKDSSYYNKVIIILMKRLQLYGYFQDINIHDRKAVENSLRSFLPYYEKQEEGIAKEKDRIRNAYQDRGRGSRESDDVRRYAVPNYIRKLSGSSKNKHTFRYAGIDNIIHLSSGIVRYLLDSVGKMYDIVYSKKSEENNENAKIEFIPTDIQDRVMRSKADDYLFNELKKANELDAKSADSVDSFNILTTNNPISTTDKLANLINAMGKTFQEILLSGSDDDPLSGRSERKVFSIALSNPSQTSIEIKHVLELGVRLGFLHESHLGNKYGNGRTYLYILNRCFAPIFTLDPTGFQGYLFMQNEDLESAIHTGKRLRIIDDDRTDEENAIYQLSLFDLWEE